MSRCGRESREIVKGGFFTLFHEVICERFISSCHIWHMVRFICMQSHITKSKCDSRGPLEGQSRTSMSTRGTEAHSPACGILKGVHTHTHTHTHTHRAILFNLSSHPCQDYVRWDKIDHFWYILMNDSIFDIFPQSLHLVECSLDFFFKWWADQLMALCHSCCF